ncbi:hypothetical protein ACN6J9_07520 [Carnobacterium maltaromaticum]|nr:hypothetical protein [Carnobacterium maltaromaticum]MBC9810499.1 hypothetical protein [Carnobacterium maltaromaticum]CRH19674.1 hypothetical protein CM318V1_520038 [Carnobacterium maltaromaticum]CRH22752.1 hypothetical protein BN1423_490019 [Carnobacterium maltaromaticum]
MWKVLTGAENDYDLFANEPIASLKENSQIIIQIKGFPRYAIPYHLGKPFLFAVKTEDTEVDLIQ